MCLKWNNTGKAWEYLEAFFKAGENDPYLEKIVEEFEIPRLKNQHIHGWGYVLVTKNTLHHYANGEFFKEDVSGKQKLKNTLQELKWEFLLMIELRVTDEWYVSAFNSHPFHFLSRNGYEWYLFYNGLLDYKKLAESENIDFSNYQTKNGTTLMGISIARALEAGKCMSDAIDEPKKALKSAYNVMMFYRNNLWKYKANITAYIAENLCNNALVHQHNKVLKKQEDNLFFVGSSAIELYKPGEYTVMDNDEHIEMDIDFVNEYYFDGYK